MTNGLPPGLSSLTSPQGNDEATDDFNEGGLGGLDDIDLKSLFGGAVADLPFDSKDKCPMQ